MTLWLLQQSEKRGKNVFTNQKEEIHGTGETKDEINQRS